MVTECNEASWRVYDERASTTRGRRPRDSLCGAARCRGPEKAVQASGVGALNPGKCVAEPHELSRLKCAGHHHKGNTGSNTLQTEQFLVGRVTSRYNHRFSDRTSIPRTKASPEILQPPFYNTGKAMITNQFKPLLQSQLK